MLVLMIPKITLCLLYVIMLSILLDGTAIADDGRAVTLEDILTFFTGADRPPPLGFQPYPTLHFCNDELASAQMCEMGSLCLSFTKNTRNLKKN